MMIDLHSILYEYTHILLCLLRNVRIWLSFLFPVLRALLWHSRCFPAIRLASARCHLWLRLP
jgi:hypothetical protein